MTRTVIPLHSLAVRSPVAPSSGAGCAASRCPTAGQAPDSLPASVAERISNHPCYSEEAHHHFARMHVAVAPGCNIQCNYCNRKYDCANESRPGVTSERLTPEQAAQKVVAVANRVPQLSVLGIAGPGDALHDAAKTFETFDRVAERVPDLTFCLSTNGLALPDHVEAIRARAIDHVTITINMVDPEIGAQIYPWIFYRNRRWTGLDAARILHERQMEGLAGLVAAGVLVKVNSVIIPGVNDQHLREVNREIRARGAFLHNLIPLISDPAHGTWFALNGQRGPTPAEVTALQEQVDGGTRLMRHCRQCRADAIGLLNQDRGVEFSRAALPENDETYDPAPRAAYRAFVDQERGERERLAAAAEARLAATAAAQPARQVAVCSKSGGRINQHFGQAREFLIYSVDAAGVRFLGPRKVDNYCLGGYGDSERLQGILTLLAGVDTIFAAKIGACPRDELAAAGVTVLETYAEETIETALADWFCHQAAAPLRISA